MNTHTKKEAFLFGIINIMNVNALPQYVDISPKMP